MLSAEEKQMKHNENVVISLPALPTSLNHSGVIFSLTALSQGTRGMMSSIEPGAR